MIEFTIGAFLLLLVMFAGLEFDRMLLVYTSLDDATKAGVRWAIVRGSGSSQQASTTDVQNQVKAYLVGIDKSSSRLTINVSFPNGQTAGSLVVVTTQYTYDPWVVPIPISGVRLSASSRGYITCCS